MPNMTEEFLPLLRPRKYNLRLRPILVTHLFPLIWPLTKIFFFVSFRFLSTAGVYQVKREQSLIVGRTCHLGLLFVHSQLSFCYSRSNFCLLGVGCETLPVSNFKINRMFQHSLAVIFEGFHGRSAGWLVSPCSPIQLRQVRGVWGHIFYWHAYVDLRASNQNIVAFKKRQQKQMFPAIFPGR